MKSLNRRNFLKAGAIGAAGIAISKSAIASAKGSVQDTPMVISRELGNTGILVPVVSMGCGKVDSPAVIMGALKMGISHFDTAARYQRGNSELLLGKILKDYSRDSFTIATKIKPKPTKEEFLKEFDASLDRLQMDHVDILYLHSVSSREEALNPTMLEALKETKAQGKAKHLGLSTHSNEPEVILTAMETGIYEVVLTAINFKQDHIAELKEAIAKASSKGMGIIGMKVMAGGFLDKEKTKPVNHKAALKWVLSDKNVHTTIPSIVNLDQLQDNIQVLKDIELSEEEKSDLAFAAGEPGLYCNGCSHCVHACKKGLPIPDLMRAYMYTYGYQETRKAKDLLNRSGIKDNPCKDCLNCTANCIKGFSLPDKISDLCRLSDIPDEFLV